MQNVPSFSRSQSVPGYSNPQASIALFLRVFQFHVIPMFINTEGYKLSLTRLRATLVCYYKVKIREDMR